MHACGGSSPLRTVPPVRYLVCLVAATGCATGAPATDDAATGGPEDDAPLAIDAPTEVDAPDLDAPAVDGSTIDAAAIDAAMIDAAAIDAALPIDARPIDAAPPIDAALPIDAGTPGPVDTCAQAPDITAQASAGTGVTLTGSTIGYANNIQATTACTGYSTLGPDAIYQVTLAAGQRVTATATPNQTYDVSLMLVTPCQMTPTCLAGDDNGLSGVTESVTYTATAATTAYVVLDGYSTNTVGTYSLVVRIQ